MFPVVGQAGGPPAPWLGMSVIGMFGAGFAPLVALVLASQFGLFSSGFYLLSGAICTVIALLASHRLELRND